MEFIVQEGSQNNFFIMCKEEEYQSWLKGDSVFVKDPTVINDLFKKLCISVTVKENSFLNTNYLDMIYLKYNVVASLFKEKWPLLGDYISEYKTTTLYDIWDIYNNIMSGISPFRKNKVFSKIKIKNKNDFEDKSLYNIIENINEYEPKFFSEVFSMYSILTMRPQYYDDEDLILNIFYEKFYNEKIYCLSWTSEY